MAVASVPLVFGLLLAAAALAGGGGSISSAPELKIGSQVTGGAPEVNTYAIFSGGWWKKLNTAGVEFYRVTLERADLLVINYGRVTGTNVALCLLKPSTTDYTLAESDCVAGQSLDSAPKRQFRFTTPVSGRWILVVGDAYCCPREPWGYELTAYVKHVTRTTLSTARLVRARSRVKPTGAVSDVKGGLVQLLARVPGQRAWKSVGVARIGNSGRFSFSFKVGGPGSYQVKAFYRGDVSHLPSAAIVRFQVA
jgi:hypothetical protein